MRYVEGVISIIIRQFAEFVPNLLGGVLIIAIGVVLASIVSHAMYSILRFFRFSALLSESKLMTEQEVSIWERIFSAVVKMSIFITFLIPAFEIWGLSRVITVLSEFLLYVPNLIIGVVIAFVGLVAANLLSEFGGGSDQTGKKRSELQIVIKGVVLFFTALIVLSQIGIAGEFVRILFTGIVFAVSLAVGLAFGLGGQVFAKQTLEEISRRLRNLRI